MLKTTLTTLGLGVLVWGLTAAPAHAQFPDWRSKPVRQNIDLIPPLGNHLPYSYAARYNRPTWLAGRIAYTIEPTSQEAMAWQRARERGYYKNKAPRMESFYIYQKPWEALGVGARTAAHREHAADESDRLRPKTSSMLDAPKPEQIEVPADKELPLLEPRSEPSAPARVSPQPPPAPVPPTSVLPVPEPPTPDPQASKFPSAIRLIPAN